ncbi:MAG: hypothetical protein WCE64_16040 [Bacteroidales bacterium]
MKSPIKLRAVIWPVSVAAGLFLLQGCAVYTPTSSEQVPVSNIVKESQAGVTSKDIIRELRSTRSVYMLNANQLAKLRNEGVQDSVISYMDHTRVNAIRREQRMNDYYYGNPGYAWGPNWGWGWGWDWGFGYPWGYGYYGGGPNVIIHGGGFDHDFHGGGFHGGERGGDRR